MDFSRTTIRGILVGIIALTMLCYVCAFTFWASSPEREQPQRTNTPVNTPIDPFDLPTRTIEGTAAVTSTTPFEQPTIQPGFTPIVPTIQIFPTFTSFPTST